MKKRRGSRRRGVALILTLLVLAILIVVVVQFAYSVKSEEIVVENTTGDAELAAAARGAVPWVEALFRDDSKNGKTPATADTLADVWDDPKLPQARQLKVGQVDVTIEVEDLERRLSLDALASTNLGKARYCRTALQRLISRCKVADKDPAKLASAITDYVRKQAGQQPLDSASGAPAPAPAPAPAAPGTTTTTPPAKRAILDIDQLLEVEDVDLKVLYGDPKAQPPTTGIARYLTTWPTTGWNLNTASDAVLFATLPEKNMNGEQIWGNEDAVIKSIRDFRIDPDQQQQAQANPTGATGSGTTTPPPTKPTSPTEGGGKGASGAWNGTALEKVDTLATIGNPQLATIFAKTTSTTAPGTPAPGAGTPATPATPTTQTDPNAFAYKDGLTVASAFYAVKATATRTADDGTKASKVVRFVVVRSPQNQAVALLYREDAP
jgi:type II secretory pathway component PulK